MFTQRQKMHTRSVVAYLHYPSLACFSDLRIRSGTLACVQAIRFRIGIGFLEDMIQLEDDIGTRPEIRADGMLGGRALEAAHPGIVVPPAVSIEEAEG